MNFNFIIILIFFIFFENILNENSFEKNQCKYNKSEFNFKEKKNNYNNNNNNSKIYCDRMKSKYHILKISPLSDLETAYNKYIELKEKISEKKDKNENDLKCLEETYIKFKNEFNKNKKVKLFDLIKYFLDKTIKYILIIIICYFFSWIIYKIQNISFISICFFFSFMLVDRTIPHIFNGFLNQMLFSLIIGELIYIFFKIIINLLKKNKNKINLHYE